MPLTMIIFLPLLFLIHAQPMEFRYSQDLYLEQVDDRTLEDSI